MRMIRFAAAVLLLVGCFEQTDRPRRPGAGGTGGGTGGGMVDDEPDAASGGQGGEGGQSGQGGANEGGAGGRPARDSGAGGTGGSARDAGAKDTALARDADHVDAPLPRDAAADLARDTSAPRDTAVPPDLAAPSDTAGGDPEPGRLAGITRFHNKVRAGIPVPPLTWDPNLAASAAAYATECMFEHSGTKGVGENLAAYAPPGDQKADAPVDDWAGEAADYDYASNSCDPGKVCGHYTQLVWKSSQRVGCAVQTCSQNSPFGAKFPNWDLWVCQYSPPGNFVGQRPY
jgi:uncharacterized protein YkwD